MLTIVKGTVDSGKSTRLAQMQRMLGGDGFVASKVLDGDTLSGYRLERLAQYESIHLACALDCLPEPWEEECRCGRFSFNRAAFQWGKGLIAELLESRVSPLFIDEVGYLELAGKGWAASVEQCLRAECDTVIAVRSPLVQDIIAKFGAKEFQVVDVEEEESE